MTPDGAEAAPCVVRAWSADAAAGLVGESMGVEDAEGSGDSADSAAGVGRAGSVCVKKCSTWCLDGIDGRN